MNEPSPSFDALARLYEPDHPAVRRHGRRYPVAVSPARLEPHEPPGGRPEPPGAGAERLVAWTGGTATVDPVLASGGERHRAELARTARALHDGPVLVLDRLAGGILHVARSGYFAMLATADALRAEYLAGAGGSDGSGSGASGSDASGAPATEGERGLSSMPLRARAHQIAAGGDPILSGAGRAAAVGVSVVTVVPGHAGPSVVLGRRRDDLATDPGLWHVAPSGMLEPPDPSGRGPGPLLSTVRRELAEELGVDAGPLRISVLGIVHDLLRLRPEVCLRLDLAEEDLPERLAAEEFGETALVELSPTGLERLWASLPPPALTPAAAGALALVEAREGWREA